MALSTENSGALMGIGSHDPSTVYATFLKTTFVESLGRDARRDETVKIAKKDATVLFPWGKARKATEEEIAAVTVTDADVSFEAALADPAEETEPDPSETEGITLTGADRAGITLTGADRTTSEASVEDDAPTSKGKKRR